MDAPNVELQAALAYLQKFNTDVTHELEEERTRIRTADSRAPSQSDSPTTILINSCSCCHLDHHAAACEGYISQAGFSLVPYLVAHFLPTPLVLLNTDSNLPIESQHLDSTSVIAQSLTKTSQLGTFQSNEVPVELLQVLIGLSLLLAVLHSIPLALGLLVIVALMALQREAIIMNGALQSDINHSSSRKWWWRSFLRCHRERVWVQGPLDIHESLITPDLRCPISLSLFVDPVCFRPTGRVYERTHIYRYLSVATASSPCDPMSRLPAVYEDYVPVPSFKARAHEIANILKYELVEVLS